MSLSKLRSIWRNGGSILAQIEVALSTDLAHKSILTITLKIMHPKRGIDWDAMRDRALYFSDDNIFFNLVCDL